MRLKNNNYQPGDSLVIIGPNNKISIFVSPVAIVYLLKFAFYSYEELKFEFKLRETMV